MSARSGALHVATGAGESKTGCRSPRPPSGQGSQQGQPWPGAGTWRATPGHGLRWVGLQCRVSKRRKRWFQAWTPTHFPADVTLGPRLKTAPHCVALHSPWGTVVVPAPCPGGQFCLWSPAPDGLRGAGATASVLVSRCEQPSDRQSIPRPPGKPHQGHVSPHI